MPRARSLPSVLLQRAQADMRDIERFIKGELADADVRRLKEIEASAVRIRNRITKYTRAMRNGG